MSTAYLVGMDNTADLPFKPIRSKADNFIYVLLTLESIFRIFTSLVPEGYFAPGDITIVTIRTKGLLHMESGVNEIIQLIIWKNW